MSSDTKADTGGAVGSDGLPTFDRPPVNETALSVQFDPIHDATLHLGVYWTHIRSGFEKAQVIAPLVNLTEQLDKPLVRPKFGIQFVAQPEFRYWFLRSNGTQLVQVQNDRFVYNWRQITGNEVYPRYPAIRQQFEDEWIRFCAFLRDEGVTPPVVNQCEVTYVNHVEYGQGWTNFGELSNVIAPWRGSCSGDFLPPPEQTSIESHYRLPGDQGRLHISAEPVIRGRDSKQVLQITLTARGAPTSSDHGSIMQWMDTGRLWVVKGFADFTTPTMHTVWGLRT